MDKRKSSCEKRNKKVNKILEQINRRIEFRVWDKKENNMYYPDNRDDNDIENILCFFDYIAPYGNGNNFILMQYVGSLENLNFKRMYEGDIVKFGYKEIGIVVFLNMTFGIISINSHHNISHWHPLLNIGDIEIIGNRYENSGLLEN